MRCLVCSGLEIQFFFIPQGPADARYYFRCSRSTHYGGNLTFPCEKSGSYLRASRHTPSTVRAKARTNRALASQISTPLSSCVPPCSSSVPKSSRFSSASNVSGTDAYYDLLEPFPSTPLSFVLRGIEFGRKPLFKSDFSLTAIALNPGMLKHGKVVDVNHLPVSLAHAHASVLKATARKHGFRLTGELVSCSTCSMAKGNRASTTHHTTVCPIRQPDNPYCSA